MGNHGRMLSLAKHSRTLWRGTRASVAAKQLTLFNLPGGDTQFRVIVDGAGTPGAGSDAETSLTGFRHLFGEPGPDEIFKIDGKPINADDPMCRQRLQQLMALLASRMDIAFPFEPLDPADPGQDPGDNPRIPSGYTYLLQLAGHDMMHSTVSLAITEDRSLGFANGRLSPLGLETLYGGGPDVSPMVYEQDTPDNITVPRTRMRLGRSRPNGSKSTAGCPLRDIARTGVVSGDAAVAPPRADPHSGDACPMLPPLTEPLIADPRNDDHAILSQLTMVFQRLHNGLLDKIDAQSIPHGNYSGSSIEAAYRRFFAVRFATTLIYRSILRNDLLAKILSPAVLALYKGAKGPLLDQPDGRIPLEFSHGAYRFGHAMVRPGYFINSDSVRFVTASNLRENSADSPDDMPMREGWIVQWSRFFEVGGTRRNYSRRIAPYYAGALNDRTLFPPIGPGNTCSGLLCRDLLSGAFAGLWSVPALFKKIRAEPKFSAVGLPDFADWKAKLAAWLGACSIGLTAADIATLSEDPPLLFFILFEAASDPNCVGTHLGPFGSILVAETFLGAFMIDKTPISAVTDLPFAQALAKIGADILATPGAFSFITHDISTMPELIAFMADDLGLGTEQPPFI